MQILNQVAVHEVRFYLFPQAGLSTLNAMLQSQTATLSGWLQSSQAGPAWAGRHALYLHPAAAHSSSLSVCMQIAHMQLHINICTCAQAYCWLAMRRNLNLPEDLAVARQSGGAAPVTDHQIAVPCRWVAAGCVTDQQCPSAWRPHEKILAKSCMPAQGRPRLRDITCTSVEPWRVGNAGQKINDSVISCLFQ